MSKRLSTKALYDTISDTKCDVGLSGKVSHNTFGQWLKWRREGLDLSQKTLAERMNCSEILVRKLETDARQPSVNVVQLLIERLGVPAERRAQFMAFARSREPSFAPFAYWTSAGHFLTNLAVQPNRLIGRDKQVLSLCNRFRREGVRLLTLVGPPGIGKTRLAIEAAWQLMDRYADGVYFVALDRITSADLVPSAIVEALGLSLNSNQPPFRAIVRYLHDRHVLLVLDNFEHVLEAASQVTDLLVACPFVHVMTTSRATLRLREEHQYRVLPLSLPQELPPEDSFLDYSAVALFVERAKAADPEFALTQANTAIVLDICTRLDGLPLAIELIAAYVKVLSPQELAPLLSGHFMLHSKLHIDLTYERHHTLKAAIDSSYQLLTPSLQHLFAQISVFVGGWSLNAAQAVCEIESGDILAGLMALLDRSLIQQERMSNGDTRFKMLVPIREYSTERLDSEGLVSKMRAKHCAYFCEFAEGGGENLFTGNDQLAWLERFDAEYANLCSALDWAEMNPPLLENRLGLIGGLEWYWTLRGRVQEGFVYSQRALAEISTTTSVPRWARMLNAAVMLALLFGDLLSAKMFAQKPYDLYVTLGDKGGAAFALLVMAYLDLVNGDLNTAESRWQESLKLAKEAGVSSLIAFAHFFLGNFYLSMPPKRNLERARQHTEQGLVAARHCGNSWMMAVNLIVFAHINLLENNRPTAQSQFEQCFTLSQTLRDKRGCAAASNGLAKIALREGDPQRAKSIYAENLQVFHEIIDRAGITDCSFGLAETLLALGQSEQAVQLLALVESNLDFPLFVPIDREQFYSRVAEAHELLDDLTFDHYWMLGQMLDWEQITPKMLLQ